MTTRKPDGQTSDRLRHDIDRGRTGDKVGHPDPAAAPLGTDAEAGGDPPSEEQLAEARRQELSHGPGPKAKGKRPVSSDD